MAQPIRVVLVDDHQVARHGLQSYLKACEDLEVVGEAISGEEALHHIEEWMPDVVIMGLLMLGGINGIEMIKQVRGRLAQTRIVALTSSTDDALVGAALRAGAIGYVRKDASLELLLASIRAAARGQSLLDPSIASVVMHELSHVGQPGADLTEREQGVLRQLALGRTNHEIDVSLGQRRDRQDACRQYPDQAAMGASYPGSDLCPEKRPFANAFMALFGRDCLPSRSALSRFLAALTPEPVEALRALFLSDLLTRPLGREEQLGGLWDRAGTHYLVFDVDGTREAARQRALPQTPDRPAPQRRLGSLCAPGYTGRKRGEVVRTRTTVLHAHTHQWLGTFGNVGNGEYRVELRQGVAAIQHYMQVHQFPEARAILRLDGQYGTGAVVADLARLSYVLRGKDYAVLDHAEVQSRLHLPPDQSFSRPESDLVRTLYDCPDVPVGPARQRCRAIVATHPAGLTKSRVGVEHDGLVYELFLTNLPQGAFTAADVVALYLHRGAFEAALADEDQEQDPDRWCSHTPCGQECWQIVSQWVWNLRLEWGHQLAPAPLRTTEFAPARAAASNRSAGTFGYAPAEAGLSWKAGRFSGRDFAPQADGTLHCPAGKTMRPTEQRREADGTLRVLYAARIVDCRGCHLREQCQWHGTATTKPRRVSLLLHPLDVGAAPVLWKDWSRRQHRQVVMQLCRHQRVEVQVEPTSQADLDPQPSPLSRAQRAHYRLSWTERLTRNAHASTACSVTIRLFGVPEDFASFLGLAMA